PGALVRDEAELEEDAARLGHLCRLIARNRQPDLPVKGIMVLVPWAAGAGDETAAAAAEACRRDLAAARAALRVSCPAVALVCDLERAPGFPELVANFKPEKRKTGRIGRKFPLLPELGGARVADVFASGLAWFCTAEFPTWIYEFFTLEQTETEPPGQATERNVRLYQILAQLLERHQRFGRVLAPVLANESGEPAMFGGCYLAATGPKPEHEQAFIAAVFHRLIEEHKNASWSPQAVREDARQRVEGKWGLVAALVGIVLLLAGTAYGLTHIDW
ncbi:MAG TPA: type VI secretion protein IcmF/TssM N-terminal domain-containing protein, partial [Gemmataceae bacterium]|nr:type VI secretion protein IcmF/TssM N-terminal domain-containing protein [Gemmataceae bacterium]